jgi:hypothetical protein
MLINKDKAQVAVLKAQYALMCQDFGPPPFSNPFPFQPPAADFWRQNQPMQPQPNGTIVVGGAGLIILMILLFPVTGL